MSFYQKDSTVTFSWVILPTGSPPIEADFDIALTPPDGNETYTNDGVTSYVAPTATVQGLVTYDLSVTSVGVYKVILSIGTDSAHVVNAQRQIFVVTPPDYILNGATVANGVVSTTQGPEIIPPIPPTPPGDPGTYGLEDLGYLDINGQVSAELSGNNGPGILDGFYTTNYLFDTGVADQAVPASWGDFQAYSTIREALEHATVANVRFAYLNVPQIGTEENPYSILHDYLAPPAGDMGTLMRHVFPGETIYSTNFTLKFAQGSNDDTLPFISSSEGGAGGTPVEWDITADDNDRIGLGLVGARLPTVSANWTDLSSDLFTAGTNTFKYDWCSDGTNIYVACNTSEIMKSTNDGVTFTNCFTTPGSLFFTKIACFSGLIVAIASTEAVYYSTDSGVTWNGGTQPMGTGSVNTLVPFNDGTDYIVAAGNLGGTYKLFRTTDGITWTQFGGSISSSLKKAFPIVSDVGSGNELFFFAYGDISGPDMDVRKMGVTDANWTSHMTAPTGAVQPRAFWVESGLLVWNDQTAGVMSYDGTTTEYTHNGYTHTLNANIGSFAKEGTDIFCVYRNLIPQGTKAEWLVQDGADYTKQPIALDDSLIAGKPISHKGDWLFAYNFKKKIYKNPGIT